MEKGEKLRRGKPFLYKLRKTTTNNKTGDNLAITIPTEKAQGVESCFFKVVRLGTSFILTSGCKP